VRVRPVLTVEATPALRSHLKGLLEEWGYEPIGVGSVDEALAALATSQFEFSLVDMDLDGTDGIDFLHRLKVQGGDPGPIILLFDPPDTKRIADAAALGADDFLQKPFKPEELENTIKTACSATRRVWGLSTTCPPAGAARSSKSIAPQFPGSSSKASCSGTSVAPSPAPTS